MIQDCNASKRHLVFQPQWDVDGMSSCCAANVILRLEASYCSAEDRRRELNYLAHDNFGSNMPYNLRNVQHDLCSPAYAIPFNMMMAAVVGSMLNEPGDPLWICTDNIRGDPGDDVHRGPFSVRTLADWLPKQGLADVHSGSTNNRDSVQTWSWRLDPRDCTEYIREQELLYNDLRAEVGHILPPHNDLHTHMRGGGLRW